MAAIDNPNVPQIPQPVANLGSLVYVAQQLKQGVDSLAGHRGTPTSRAVTFDDLVRIGILTPAQAAAATSV